jgi:uncharacterized protein (TIRG00374 family)
MRMTHWGAGRLRLPGWRSLVRWAVAALSVVLVARVGGLGRDEITQAMALVADLDPVLIAAVLALEAAWAVTLAQTVRSAVLAVGGAVGHVQVQRISMAGFTLSRAVPGGGAAGGVFAMRELTRLGNPAPVAVTAATASWATTMTSLAVLVFGGLVAVAVTGDVPGISVVPAALVLAALALTGCVVLRALHSEPLRRRLTAVITSVLRRLPFGPDIATVERTLGGVGARADSGRHLRRSFAWATAAWLCDAAALWLVFAACGHRLSLAALLIGYGSANLLNSIPELTPGWLGVFEAALSATYIGLGVPSGIAVAAVLIYRLASFWLPVAAGVAPAVRSFTAARGSPARGVPPEAGPPAAAVPAGPPAPTSTTTPTEVLV